MENVMNNNFVELNENELMDIDGGDAKSTFIKILIWLATNTIVVC